MKKKILAMIFVVTISLCLAFLTTGCANDDENKYKPLAEQEIVYVSSIEELLNAIKPFTHIVLKAGDYNMTQYLEAIEIEAQEKWNKEHKFVKIEEVFDGTEVIIEDIEKLTIAGGGNSFVETELVTDPRYAAVLNFKDCIGLKLCNFTAGHTDKGYCTGNVINLFDCKNVVMEDLDLYGCGVYGIGAYDSEDIYVEKSTIRDCSYGPLEIFDCDGNIKFLKCTFTGSEGYCNMDDLDDVKLHFAECTFGSWESSDLMFRENISTTDCTWDEDVIYPEY